MFELWAADLPFQARRIVHVLDKYHWQLWLNRRKDKQKPPVQSTQLGSAAAMLPTMDIQFGFPVFSRAEFKTTPVLRTQSLATNTCFRTSERPWLKV
jgi:hypothetical protein